jgi:hypothetical protein
MKNRKKDRKIERQKDRNKERKKKERKKEIKKETNKRKKETKETKEKKQTKERIILTHLLFSFTYVLPSSPHFILLSFLLAFKTNTRPMSVSIFHWNLMNGQVIPTCSTVAIDSTKD